MIRTGTESLLVIINYLVMVIEMKELKVTEKKKAK